MTGDDRCACQYRSAGSPCGHPATWGIVVGDGEPTTTCDDHRNAVLMQVEAKDVSAIFPIESAPGED